MRVNGRLLTAVGAIALMGCDSAHVKNCEEQLLEKLKAPSTYKRIGVSQMALTAGKPPHYHMVEIEYDAQNSYGALLRDKEICSYRLDSKGSPTLELFDPYGSIGDANVDAEAAEAAADRALEAAGRAVEDAGKVVEAAGAAIEETQNDSLGMDESGHATEADSPALSNSTDVNQTAGE